MALLELKLLAHVPGLDEDTHNYCAGREGKFPYFRRGFVDMGLARSIEYTEAIREATEGYAIADQQGAVQAVYKTAERAAEAIAKAQPRFIADIELEQDDEVAQS